MMLKKIEFGSVAGRRVVLRVQLVQIPDGVAF